LLREIHLGMTAKRTDLLAELETILRKIGARSVLMSETVGQLVGLNSTDLKCLDLLALAGPTTAGQLAKHAGLSTGAMTAVIDRLERAGFVRRTRDAEDRRVVLVEALPRSVQRISPLYERLVEATARLNARYTDRQLAVVLEYLSRAFGLVVDHVTWLQTQRPTRRVTVGRQRPVRRGRAAVAAAPRSQSLQS
jgi:DNA-binding MarR family transcriptional regulator